MEVQPNPSCILIIRKRNTNQIFMLASVTDFSSSNYAGNRIELRSMDIVRQKDNSLVNAVSWLRRKTSKRPSHIPLVVSKRGVPCLESLQQTVQAASSNPASSQINGILQERTGTLQKFIFPAESKDLSVRLGSIPVLKESVILCDHHLSSDVLRLFQDGAEPANLVFVDRDEILGNPGLNLEFSSCTTEAVSKYLLDQMLEPDLQNKLHFRQEVGRLQHCTEKCKPTLTCASVSSEAHQGSVERSKQERDSREKCSSDDRMPCNHWIIDYKPNFVTNSDSNFTYTDAVRVTGEH